MNTYYCFEGHVIPNNENISLQPRNFTIDTGRSTSIPDTIIVDMKIDQSYVTMTVDHPREFSDDDLWAVKHHLQRLALFTIAAHGFVSGTGLDVEITSLKTGSPPCEYTPFPPRAPEIPLPSISSIAERLPRLIALGPNQDAHNPHLRLAVINYMRAVREPQETFMFSYRAIEAIRHYFDQLVVDHNGKLTDKEVRDQVNAAWKRLRQTLNLDKDTSKKFNESSSYLGGLEQRAKTCRHGDQCIPSQQEYLAALKIARTVIERFTALDVKEPSKQSLSENKFPFCSPEHALLGPPPSACSQETTGSTSSVSSTNIVLPQDTGLGPLSNESEGD